MADMTAEEAIEKLENWIEYVSNTRQGSYKTVELEYDDAQAIATLIQHQTDEIKRLQDEIVKRECCANCGKFNIEWTYTGINSSCDTVELIHPGYLDKCDKWEMIQR